MARCKSRFKRMLDKDVLTLAQERIAYVFDNFPRVYASFSGGKDSTVMAHLIAEEARRRGRKFGLLFIDLEAQYKLTIDHVARFFAEYADVCEPFWVALPLHLRNAVSMLHPYWVCWDAGQQDGWVRQLPANAITDLDYFPWFSKGMEFEEFIEEFGHWYGKGLLTACFVGIRCDESLDRWRAISRPKNRFEDKVFTTWKARAVYNIYPIYDWSTEDLWTYTARFQKSYNKLYDLMFQAGLSIHQARICQPYGDDQRKGLWLYSVIEPETWPKIVARVSGANSGALYSRTSGAMTGRGKIEKPANHTWESYAQYLLASMPDEQADHYRDKIAVFIHWWQTARGVDIVDEGDPKLEGARKIPSWRRVCKVLLKNDHICKGLSFSQQRSSTTTYERYKKVMKKRREAWGLF